MTTDIERMKIVMFDMLACLSYLRSRDLLPPGDFERMETEARALLEIEPQEIATPQNATVIISEPELPLPMPTVEVMHGFHKCPKCGDTGPKIVHLKRRPRGGLQCQACRHEYALQAYWI